MAKCKTRKPPKRAPRVRTHATPPHLDFFAVLDAHVKAKEWARKGIEYANAGKIKQARECERKALFWMAKVRNVESTRVRPWLGRQ